MLKPKSARFIDHANIVLAPAAVMLRAGVNEDAARAAYLASFHAARGYIFECTDQTFKTHRGVQREFLRLIKDDPGADLELGRFLSRSYEFKSVADYFSGPDPVTSSAEAAEAIETAKRFVAHFAALVPIPDADPDGVP